jgi:hypothetical protein
MARIAPWLKSLRAALPTLSRRAKWAIGSFAALLLVTGACIAGAQPLVDWAIGKIYQNVVPPEDGEMALTVTSYPSSSRVASIIGGKGEGLNCSINRIAKLFFPRYVLNGKTTTATDLFRQACVFHDLCYRHGLATYGYTQADCDQMLQEQAARLCTNISGGEPWSTNCQLNAKKLLAGVSHGGFDSYQSWRSSTYYEFDSSPSTSEHMSVARVIDHPFKKADPVESRDDPDQLLLTFDISRSNAMIACRNCSPRMFSPAELRAANLLELGSSRRLLPPGPARVASADEPGGAMEFSSRAVQRARHDLVRPKYTQTRPIGLPSEGIYSAPHVLTAEGGEQMIVWLNRRKPENTVSCAIIADPKNLLTHTRSKDIDCRPSASDRLKLARADLYASSPQPELVALPQAVGQQPSTGLVGTGLSMAEDGLQVCLSTDLRASPPPGQKPKCFRLRTPSGEPIAPELGTFQNFPIIKRERHIYLSRNVFNDPARQLVAGAGRALVFDVGGGFVPPVDRNVREVRLHRDRPFDIPDDYDPMLPLTRDGDLRLLGVKTSGGKVGLYEIDLESEKPQPVQITTLAGANASKVELDASWARRPILVMDQPAENGEPAKTQLVLSRSLVTTTEQSGDTLDGVRLEFLVLERDKSAKGADALKQVRGLACQVTYTLKGANPSRPCQRSSAQVGDKRPSPAQMLQGAQLVAGKLMSAGQKGLDLAMPDACYPDKPIVLQPIGIDAAAAAPGLEVVDRLTVEREKKAQRLRQVDCGPLNDAAQIAGAMSAPK